MKNQTETVIASICAADETIKKADMLAALSLLRGDKNAVAESCDVPLTREEAAAMLRVSRQTVTVQHCCSPLLLPALPVLRIPA